MKCLLVSFFNSANIGDCILSDMLFQTASLRFEVEKYSYTGNPNVFTDINDIKSTNYPKGKNIKSKIYDSFKKYNFSMPIQFYNNIFKSTSSLKELETRLNNVDILIIGGGNMIFDKDKFTNSASRFNDFVSVAKNKNIKIFATSLGIGPFQTPEQEKNAVIALKKCDYITFRDQKSYNIYEKYFNDTKNVFLTIDPVFTLPLIVTPHNNGKTIGVNIFNSQLITNDKDEYLKLMNDYEQLIKKLLDTLDVKIILFSTDLKDYEAVYNVYRKFENNSNVEVREINGFDCLIDMYSSLTMLIGARMHTMIIAFTQNIPIIGLSWQPKIDAFFDIIEAKEFVYQYNYLDANLQEIVNSCEKIITNIDSEKNKMNKKLKLIKKRRLIDEEIMEKLSSR